MLTCTKIQIIKAIPKNIPVNPASFCLRKLRIPENILPKPTIIAAVNKWLIENSLERMDVRKIDNLVKSLGVDTENGGRRGTMYVVSKASWESMSPAASNDEDFTEGLGE